MSAVEWQIGVPTGNSLTTHRGTRVVVKLSQTGSPIEIAWFIEGPLAESSSVDCNLDLGKKIGVDVVDCDLLGLHHALLLPWKRPHRC